MQMNFRATSSTWWAELRWPYTIFDTAGRDISKIDAYEALVFWLRAKKLYDFRVQGLLDPDGDGWLEYRFVSNCPEDRVKVFRLNGRQVEAVEMLGGDDACASQRRVYRVVGGMLEAAAF